jgi:uncharacterized protein (DUF2141 family)
MEKNLLRPSALLSSRVLVPLLMVCTSLSPLTSAQAESVPATTGKLLVSVQGMEQAKGQVCFSLFNKAQGFPSKAESAIQSRCVEVTSTTMTVTFDGLPSGNYAVAVFHDLNKDGILNQNRLGIPTEKFGFSNNPRIIAGPPRFSDSTVLLAGQETTITIKLRGLLG